MPDYRPHIGITMRIELETERFYLSRHYSEAIEAAGGVPLHISLIPSPAYLAATMDGLDGILLPGSDSDVDQLGYGGEQHQALAIVHPIKDEPAPLLLKGQERGGRPELA